MCCSILKSDFSRLSDAVGTLLCGPELSANLWLDFNHEIEKCHAAAKEILTAI